MDKIYIELPRNVIGAKAYNGGTINKIWKVKTLSEHVCNTVEEIFEANSIPFTRKSFYESLGVPPKYEPGKYFANFTMSGVLIQLKYV